MSASEPGDEQRAGGALEEAEDDQQLERRREAAQRGGEREAGQAERIDAAPAVVVGQGAGEDEQRGQDGEIAADDVGLALERRRRGEAGRSCPICLSATLTRVPSRKTAPEPMIVATRVHRWRRVMPGQCRSMSPRDDRLFGLDSADARTRGARRRR